jgi:hypothetical protein
MPSFWMSSKVMTVQVGVVNGKIASAPPIVGKFIGQPIDNLRKWMQTQPGYKEKEMK